MVYVFIVEDAHELELPERPLRVGRVLERASELLYGHIQAQLCVPRATAHNT